MSALDDSLVSAPPAPISYYRFSVLFFGFVRMWRAFLPMIVVFAINAVLQTLLVLPYTPTASQFVYVPLAILSGIVFLLTYSVVVAAALRACDGPVAVSEAIAGARANFWRFALWSILYFVVVVVGLWFYTYPGLVFGALFVFVPIAAADGQSNPLAANFRVIGRRFIRYLVTILIVGVILLVVYLLLIASGFFVTNGWVAAVDGVILGGVSAWLITTFALIYKGATAR